MIHYNLHQVLLHTRDTRLNSKLNLYYKTNLLNVHLCDVQILCSVSLSCKTTFQQNKQQMSS